MLNYVLRFDLNTELSLLNKNKVLLTFGDIGIYIDPSIRCHLKQGCSNNTRFGNHKFNAIYTSRICYSNFIFKGVYTLVHSITFDLSISNMIIILHTHTHTHNYKFSWGSVVNSPTDRKVEGEN